MKVAFFSVVFPGAEPYLNDFFKSLEKQSYKEFALVVVNDGLTCFSDYMKEYKDLSIIEIKFSDSPAKIREYGLKYLGEQGYHYVVFGDSDDYFPENRVKIALDYLVDYDIMVNDLTIVDNKKNILDDRYLSTRLTNKQVIDGSCILDKNFMGLSNTAVRVEILRDLTIPSELIAVDWYMYTVLLQRGRRAVFTDDTITYYRQHDNNLVGMNKFDDEMLLRGLDVKMRHYTALSSIGEDFMQRAKYYTELKRKINTRRALTDYREYLRSNKKEHSLWWENIM